MKVEEARVEPEILDLLQVAVGKVPIEEFRLLPDCADCNLFAAYPATPGANKALRNHILAAHGDLIVS